MRNTEKGAFLALFFISGACGLTYEIVWSRLLVFVFGGTTFAITTVLTCFMGGLALGSWLAGRHGERLAERFGRPERVYGFLEIGIGAFALLVPVLMDLSIGIYRAVAGAVGELFIPLTVTRILVSGAILILPTTAMGATLPLLATAFSRHRGETRAGGNVAVLYGANTLGAFVGCAAAGFLLLPRLGLFNSTLTVASLNFFAGAVALFLARRSAGEVKATDDEEPADADAAPEDTPAADGGASGSVLSGRRLLLLYGLSGFAAMAYQVAWSRALILSLGSSTYSFSLIVSCYIFGLAVGSLLMTPLVDRFRRPLAAAGVLQAVIAVGSLFVAPLFGKLPEVVEKATAAEGATFDSVLLVEAAWVFGLLILPTLCMGALLPLVCRAYRPPGGNEGAGRVGRSVGDVYASNTAGTILGSAVAGFVLIPWAAVGMEHTIHVASALNLLVGTAFLLAERPRPAARYVLAGGAWALAVLALGVAEPWSREQMTSGPYLGREKSEDWHMVYYREGIDTTVAVEREGDTHHLSLSVNGKPDASNMLGDMPTQMLLGMIPSMLRPDAEEICIIGLGSGMSVGSMLLFDPVRVDVAEISEAVVEASRFFDDDSHAPLEDPRVTLYRADGRNLLLLTDEPYDMVLSEPSNPWISGISNLFTKDFFELSKSRLKPGGLHAQWIQGYTMPPEDFAAVLHTLGQVFEHYQVWEMSLNDYVVVASDAPLRIDMERLYDLFDDPAIRDEFGRIYITNPFQLANHFVTDREHVDPWLAGLGLETLTDDHNFLEFNAPRYLLAETQDEIGAALYALGGAPEFTPDAEGELEQIFLRVVDRTRQRGRRFRALSDLAEAHDVKAYFQAMEDVMEFGRTDIRTLFDVAKRIRLLTEAGLPAQPLEERAKRIKPDAWPFGRINPNPPAVRFLDEADAILAEGGDLRAATGYYLRARLREPDNPRALYGLARSYAARGDRERTLETLREAVEAGAADALLVEGEPLFDFVRDEIEGFPAVFGG